MSNEELVRLSKIMSQRGLCSRREADKFIEQGLVEVDGVIIKELGTKISPNQEIRLKSAAKQKQQQLKTVLINKPAGYVSGLPEAPYQSAITLLDNRHRQIKNEKAPTNRRGFAPAGRLDIDSTGLIVFTQDGRIAKQLIGADSKVEKEYLVWVDGVITEEKIKTLCHGLKLDGQALRPAKIEKVKDNQLRFILKQGRKRQIRRMCELVDLEVTRLLRIRIGNIKLGTLAPGKWRYLKPNEHF